MNSDGTYTTTIELTIEKFREDQKGSYECMLLPNDGSSKERTEILVKLVAAATVRFEPEVGELLIAEGYTLKIMCIVEGHSSPNADILWSVPYSNFLMKPMNSKKEFQRMEKTNSDGTYTTTTELTIEKFREDQSGTYVCILSPDDGRFLKTNEILVKLVAEYKSQPVYYFGNDTTLLFCSPALGQDAKIVGWFKGDKPIEKGEKYKLYENGSLGIMDLDRDDAGLYKLRFELNTNMTYDCCIQYRAGPLVLDMDKSINAEVEGSVEIKCEVKGWPHPKVTWLKNKEEITPNGNTITFSEHQGVKDAKLTLSSLEYDDEGMYTCRAYTKDFFNETSVKSFKLRVKATRSAIPTSSSGVAQISLSLFLFKVTPVLSMVSTLVNPLFVWMKIIFL